MNMLLKNEEKKKEVKKKTKKKNRKGIPKVSNFC